MSDEGGKKLGLVGGGLAAIGLLFARTADDWAPRAGRFGDELGGLGGSRATRGWGHGAALGGEAGAGRWGHGLALGGEGAEARWAHGLGGDDALHAPPSLADDFVPSGGHPDGDLLADAVELGADVALDVASNLPDDDSTGPSAPTAVLAPVAPGPRVIALLPIDEMEGVAMYGEADSDFLDGFRDTLSAVASSPNAASLAFRLRRAAELEPPPPLVVVGYANELGYRLDGGELATARVRDRCAELGLRCALVTCPGPEPGERCAAEALGAISRALLAMEDAALDPAVLELRLRSSLDQRLAVASGATLVPR